MKISYIQNTITLSSTETRISYNLYGELKRNGIDVLLNEYDEECDFVLCMNGLSQIHHVMQIKELFPNAKTVMYVWDCYPWTRYFHEYENVKLFDEIWVPSTEVIIRLNQAYSIPESKCKVIKSYVEFFDSEEEVVNDGFAYHFVRPYPADPNYGITDKACKELGINLFRGNHQLSEKEYRKKILSCSFLITEYMEASTGGLTLLEGYYHGKNVLVSDSIYMGARDYFGDRAYYFKNGDFEDLKRMINYLHNLNYEPNLEERREWCKQYTIEAMTKQIIDRLKELS